MSLLHNHLLFGDIYRLLKLIRRSEGKKKKHAHLTDECTELTRSETIIETSEDGNGDYNVAEETAEVVKSVHTD